MCVRAAQSLCDSTNVANGHHRETGKVNNLEISIVLFLLLFVL